MATHPPIRTLLSALLPALLISAAPALGQLGNEGAQLLQQDVDGFPGISENGDRLGAALAAGDFDGDGHLDLAIGAPSETPAGSASFAGVVTVVYGTADGLDPASGEEWTLDETGSAPAGELDHFGEAVAAADFDGDGYDDLAIGVPDRDVSDEADAGLVVVLYGSASGITTVSQQSFHQGVSQIEGALEPDDWFGEELAAGDFDGDGYADLVIGAPGEQVGDFTPDAGAVHVIHGSILGLTPNATVNDQIWTQDTTLLGASHDNAVFGRALAVGDFDADGYDDLAIGAPQGDYEELQGAGQVTVLFGSGTGLGTAGAQYLDQSGAVPGDPDQSARFGTSLAAGDLDGDGDDDLVIGVPFADRPETPGSDTLVNNAGAVVILDGTPTGLTTAGALLLDRNDADDELGAEDDFGASLAVGLFDGGPADLAVGVPGSLVGTDAEAGRVFAFAGAAAGKPIYAGSMSQDGEGPGAVEPDDRVGTTLAIGDFDGDGFDDLAIGVPEEGASGANDAGVVAIYYSQGLFRDDFERYGYSRWSTNSYK